MNRTDSDDNNTLRGIRRAILIAALSLFIGLRRERLTDAQLETNNTLRGIRRDFVLDN